MPLHILFIMWLYWILNTNNDLLTVKELLLKVLSGFAVFFLNIIFS